MVHPATQPHLGRSRRADSRGEQESIADYVHESENLAHLHMKIRSCDKLLEGMEDVLGGFQADLGKVSEEIKAVP